MSDDGDTAQQASGPLAGVRVLEFSQLVAGPFSGLVLSDFGAEVVKVEGPLGDPHRNYGAVVPREGKRFQSVNRGKRSLVVDLKNPRGQALIRRVLPHFDVMTTNLRQEATARFGLDYESVASIDPSIIYCHISAFGSHGPLADQAGTDVMMQAYTGLMAGDAKIDADGTPLGITAAAVSDYTSGLAAATAVCAALYARAQTGKGQYVETSLLRTSLAIQDSYVMREPVTDATIRDPMMQEIAEARAAGQSYQDILDIRGRARLARWAFRTYYGGFHTSDGMVVLGALTPATRNAARAILDITDDPSDHPDFDANDPENMVRSARVKDRARELMRQRSTSEWVDIFSEAGVPVAPVKLPEELADDPQVIGAGIMVHLDHPLTGPQQVVGPIAEMSETPTGVQRPAPTLGGDTEAVLIEAGLTSDEVATLREQGVVR